MQGNYATLLGESLIAFFPVLILTGMLLVIISVNLISRTNKYNNLIFLLSVVAAAWSTCYVTAGMSGFAGMMKYTPLNIMGQWLCLLAAFLFGVIQFFKIEKKGIESYCLIFGILIGSLSLLVSQNYLLFFLGLETVSLSSYALTYFGNEQAKEAAIKYLVFGAVASAVMLFGISLLYGLSGSLDIYTSLNMITQGNQLLIVVPVVFFLAGMFFKIGAFPFHFWLPEVYRTISFDVIGLFSTVPKIAVFTFLFTWFDAFKWFSIQGYSLAEIFAFVAVITLFIGTFTALKQQTVKGILAYSVIAHTAFILIPVLVGGEFGEDAFLVYLFGYVLALFGVVCVLEIFNRNQLLEFHGLGMQQPFVGGALVLMMLSLTGIPPTIGFAGKLVAFISLWNASLFASSSIVKFLFFFGIFNTVVALFYYMKIPYVMFLKKKQFNNLQVTLGVKIVVGLLALSIVVTFVKVDWLLMFLKSYY